ncbi:hypothetical protein M436DRAFT_62393 [Aureobasidium namibiae CBS 147.97]|uniref:Uncharacterized protein n=1 Tax=Aureobasidium namibiae CBS 147.97 TaxID=1043004 RepID=A0A074WYX0_9PEZI|nr:uncharacterized protein M436DRAFT_62393 [Aureobasidium namibiae CBS 147.97]KEQ74977.1 hypothetical protein M436DRAFT_62393 [Aureobasidium namibiae CBS 147.97]
MAQPTVAPRPDTVDLGDLADLPAEVRLMIYQELNDAARHSQVYLACRTGGANDQQTNLFLVNGHPLSYITRALVWDADGTYPFGIIRNNRLPLLVQVDMSSSNPHHSLAAICAVVNAQPGFQNKIKHIKFKGWESISFRGLVQLIIDCVTDPHITSVLQNDKYTWSECQSYPLGSMLTLFWKDVLRLGGGLPVPDPVEFVAKQLWAYLNPPAVRPTGLEEVAKWVRQRQIRERMNTGFFSSLNVTEALQKS